MPVRKIVLTQEAVYDITDLSEYVEICFGRETADRFAKEIKEQIQTIGQFPEGFEKTQINYRNYRIHKKAFPPSVIFYIVQKNEIHILRVIRQERDWKKILKDQNLYSYPE